MREEREGGCGRDIAEGRDIGERVDGCHGEVGQEMERGAGMR